MIDRELIVAQRRSGHAAKELDEGPAVTVLRLPCERFNLHRIAKEAARAMLEIGHVP
ncbi:hypothetical protein [Rhizobium sullae]|uniref:hypothetical protein n=1 Tax=Rhizobium sullae TaxID=50338 RepID=UPI0015C6429C|nr:hypothetical protein [Rhizobium sullae]